MATPKIEADEYALDPVSRICEILIGLTLISSISTIFTLHGVGKDQQFELVLYIGCSILAWAVILSVSFFLSSLTSKGRIHNMLLQLRSTEDARVSKQLISSALPYGLTDMLEPPEINLVRERVIAKHQDKDFSLISGADFMAALQVFLLVFFGLLPLLVPHLFINNPIAALKLSIFIAVLMLFALGNELGRYVGKAGWKWGITAALSGSSVILFVFYAAY